MLSGRVARGLFFGESYRTARVAPVSGCRLALSGGDAAIWDRESLFLDRVAPGLANRLPGVSVDIPTGMATETFF